MPSSSEQANNKMQVDRNVTSGHVSPKMTNLKMSVLSLGA